MAFQRQGRVSYALSFLWWPLLFGGAILALDWRRAVDDDVLVFGMTVDSAVIAFNLVYFALLAAIFVLERLFPYNREWLHSDGQITADIGHTFLTKGFVQVLITAMTLMGVAHAVGDDASWYWPSHWPMWAQVGLGLAVTEFGLYWAHRIAHEWPYFWRFHAVHHSARRLWVVNTGRFHFVDTLFSLALAIPLIIATGAPTEVVQWGAAIHGFVGLLTHCNVDMRFGPLSYVFNTPGLHRWHHSKDPAEGDKNYGENLVLWDLLFGTWYNPNKRPPVEIGVKETMPDGFLAQLAAPFRWERLQAQGSDAPPQDIEAKA